MDSIAILIVGFVTCAILIIFSGSRLSKYGDIIAELTGMGKAWFGLIMMAAVTSLPELFTGISSVVLVDTPDIAVGDVMGSCAFNLLILAILDYFVPGKPISSVVTKSHVLAGLFGIFLITLQVIAMVFGNQIPVIGWFSSISVLLIIIYIIAIRLIFKNEQRQMHGKDNIAVHPEPQTISLNRAIKRYIFFALIVIVAAIGLPFFADHLADEAGLSKSFVGTLLVAATTSLPELAVSIAAVRMGSMDIAVGNLLGSNIFNMLILAIDDLLYTKGPLLAASNTSHALSGMVAVLMTVIAGIGILYSSPSKKLPFAVDAILVIILYTVLILALYNM